MGRPKNRWLDDNSLIAGRTKSGKSYYFEHEILPHINEEDFRPIIILDYKDQYFIGDRIHICHLETAEKLSQVMRGEFTKGRKPKVLRIIDQDYNPWRIDRVIFKYLCHASPKIFVMEEGHFYFEKYKHKPLPYYTRRFFRTMTGEHNMYPDGTGGHNCIIITQYPNDIPSTVLNAFGDGAIFYLPPKSLKYLYDQKFLEDDWREVRKMVAPFKSYRHYDILSAAMGEDNQKIDDES